MTREDVAHLAGVCFKWYTLFESAAAPGVSRKFLDSAARVLRLDRAERRHLFSLLGFSETYENEDVGKAPETLGRLVDELAGAPSAAYSATFDVLYHNDAYDALFRHTEQIPGLQAVKVWRLFMDEKYKTMWRDWEGVARHVTNELRFLNLPTAFSPAFRELLEQLERNREFRRLWNEGDVNLLTAKAGHFELDVPRGGAMALNVLAMLPPDRPRLFFVALLPSPPRLARGWPGLCDDAGSEGTEKSPADRTLLRGPRKPRPCRPVSRAPRLRFCPNRPILRPLSQSRRRLFRTRRATTQDRTLRQAIQAAPKEQNREQDTCRTPV